MGAKGTRPAYATPYGAYGPRVGQIPNPAYRRPGAPAAPVAAPVAAAPAQVVTRPAAPVYAAAPAGNALALDAADGVIDGRYFGAPIAQGAAAFGAPTYTTAFAAPAAAAAFAAPTYSFGAPAYNPYAAFATPSYATPAMYGGFGGGFGGFPGYGGGFGGFGGFNPYASFNPYAAASFGPTLATGSQQSALALDAADGVIDGKFYGQQVGVAAPAAYGFGNYGF